MNVSREEKKTEAVARMKLWGIFPQVIQQFEESNQISESEAPIGACYWLDDEQMQRVCEFEERNNALVYHIVHTFANIGEMESFLYVSDYPEEWEYDREDIKNGEPLAYVFNKDMPDCSEFGYIGVELTAAGGLCRTW